MFPCQCESEEQSEPMCERSASPCSCPETRHHVSIDLSDVGLSINCLDNVESVFDLKVTIWFMHSLLVILSKYLC